MIEPGPDQWTAIDGMAIWPEGPRFMLALHPSADMFRRGVMRPRIRVKARSGNDIMAKLRAISGSLPKRVIIGPPAIPSEWPPIPAFLRRLRP